MKAHQILLAVLVMGVTANADLRLWPEDGLPVRQGHHTEWVGAGGQDGAGNTLIAWSDARTGDFDIYVQLFSPAGVQLFDSGGLRLGVCPAAQEDPAVAAVDGGWIIAWADFRVSRMGPSFWEPSSVWALKIDPQGNLFPGWDMAGIVVDSFRQAFLHEHSIHVVHDGAGGAIVAWVDSRRDGADVYAQHLLADGQRAWPNPLAVTDTISGQYALTAASDGNGGMLVAWEDARNAVNRNIYAVQITPDGQLPWGGVNGTLVCGAAGRQQSPHLCPDGAGGCYLAWLDYRGGTTSDLYIQRLDASGQALWTANGIALSNAPNDQSGVRLAVSLSGRTQDGCIAVWQDRRVNNEISEVYVQKISPEGNALWMAGGFRVCGDAQPPWHGTTREGARITSDLAGGLVCAWEDMRETGNWDDADLYAARVLANGSFAWGSDCGIEVASAQNRQCEPVLCADDGDGVFVFYDDTRSGSQSLRVQNLALATGQPTLDLEGIIILESLDGDAGNPRAISMSGSRVGIVWEDSRFGQRGFGLFYQIFDMQGNPLLPANGAQLVPDNEGYDHFNQMNAALCPDGNGGFFCAFEDLRATDKRIRLTRVDATGQIVGDSAATIVWEDDFTTDQVWCHCAPDGMGGCYVAWSNYDLYYYIDAYVMRMDTDCQPVWAAPVRLTDTPQEDDLVFGAVAGDDGCCIVVWRWGGFDQFDISSARVCGNGTVAWNLAICDAPNIQDCPVIVADGEGGAYFAWQDKRLPAWNYDIYAQHVSAEGTELWLHNGLLVISDTLYQFNPRIALAPDGIYLVWKDFRSGSQTNLYGQYVAGNGTRLWPEQGLPMSLAAIGLPDVEIETDAAGNLFAAWANYEGEYLVIGGTCLGPDGLPINEWWVPQMGGPIYDVPNIAPRCPVVAPVGSYAFAVVWEHDARTVYPLYNLRAQLVQSYLSTEGETETAVPTRFALSQNYPNPFNPQTRIEFALPRATHAKLVVYDLLGRVVTVLADEQLSAGVHSVSFDARSLPSGLYFYRLQAGDFLQTRKMVLLR
ncbi:T9SS type A sorting domain-containing protein [bacterium]|nr:T9SS type A sorting domain-containing protein [bacterium]MBU1983120.1 T9SS type A sorting domain-containing protein [bacterium]